MRVSFNTTHGEFAQLYSSEGSRRDANQLASELVPWQLVANAL